MKTSAICGGLPDFSPIMRQQEREHCRLDLDKVDVGAMSADDFVTKWREALRALIITRL